MPRIVHARILSDRDIHIRDGKGSKDRSTMLPGALLRPLQLHLKGVEAVHKRDLEDGFGRVELPNALARKYPSAPRERPRLRSNYWPT